MPSIQMQKATMTARKIPKPGREIQRDQRGWTGGLACVPGMKRLLRGVLLTTMLVLVVVDGELDDR
jgi:hypothetical protein